MCFGLLLSLLLKLTNKHELYYARQSSTAYDYDYIITKVS